jgi:hypothetical protein
LPSINAMAHELAPDGLSSLLIDIGEDASLVARAVKDRGYTAPVALDADMRVTQAYGVLATPTVVLVGRDGQVLTTVVGPRPWASRDGRALLQRLLAMGPPTR